MRKCNLGHLSKLKQGTRAMAIRRNHGRLVDCSTEHNHIWRYIWTWSRSYLETHLMLVIVFILKQEAIRRTLHDTLNRQWQKRKAEEAVTFWHTDKTPCLVWGSTVYMASSDLWSAMYFTVGCISAIQFTVKGDTFTYDIPRTFWRKMENEPKMSRFRHQQPQKILHN